MRPPIEDMDQWRDFNGHYEKHECDIMLKDGSIIEYCWPNNGFFSKMDDATVMTYFSDVAQVKYHDYFKKLKGKH
jgi:hypothetical protein